MAESTTENLQITSRVSIPLAEIVWTAIRAQGSGGQNVNKVSSAIHLRFDIRSSSLPQEYKTTMLASGDTRITKDGVVVIKSQNHRTQERNLADALERLRLVVHAAGQVQTKRKATKPTRGSIQRRLTGKSRKAKIKANRRRVGRDD
jgi:ribosome-associated protein